MIFHFKTNSVTFFPEDQEYFEAKLLSLKKYMGSIVGDEDTVDAHVTLEKTKHHSGDRFECGATLHTPKNGHFHAAGSCESIRACADELHEKLKAQIQHKFQ